MLEYFAGTIEYPWYVKFIAYGIVTIPYLLALLLTVVLSNYLYYYLRYKKKNLFPENIQLACLFAVLGWIALGLYASF